MSFSARIRRTAIAGIGAATVGLVTLALTAPAQAATTAPTDAAHALHSTANPVQSDAFASRTAFNNLGLTTRQAQAVQGWLQDRYAYPGPINGELDNESWRYLQIEMTVFGTYNGPIDGIVDSDTIAALQLLLRPPIAGYQGPIDGVDSPATEAAFALYAEGLIIDSSE
ncbi:peptidoglycan-binding protein [Streptomyces tendae]|uniref:peptidoglycan-binding protein n=1 Tax=Streptomyces tendae TaxID=1932 RepID=UPI0033C49DC2